MINTLFAQGQSKSTVKRRVACYKSMFSWFENEELIQQTPFHKLDIKIKLPLRLPRNLSNEELKKLRRASIANLEMANTRNANFKRLPRKRINHLTTFMGIDLWAQQQSNTAFFIFEFPSYQVTYPSSVSVAQP